MLARWLGYRHPRLMLEEMTVEEWIEWQAHYDHAPWDDDRADLRSAAQTTYLLTALAGEPGAQFPSLTWPYWDDHHQPIDLRAAKHQIDEHRKRYG